MTAPLFGAVRDISAGNGKIPTSEMVASGALAVVDQGRDLVAGFTESVEMQVPTDRPVIVFGDHTRALKFIDFPFAMGADGVKVLQPRDGYLPKFVYHYLRFAKIPSAGYSRHFKFLKEIEVPHPPIDQQHHIVSVLDEAERLMAFRRTVLDELEMLTRSIFREALNSTGSRTARLREIADFVRGVTFKPADKVALGTDTVAVMRTKNVQLTLDRSDEIHLPKKLIRRSDHYLQIGDTLISSANSWNLVGRACYVDEVEAPAVVGGFVTALRTRGGIDPLFLYFWFTSPQTQAAVRSFSSRTTNIANLNLKRCAEMDVPIPPIDVQKEFARRVEVIRKHRTKVRTATSTHDELFASLQRDAFRGEL